jgi:hypothetical protein
MSLINYSEQAASIADKAMGKIRKDRLSRFRKDRYKRRVARKVAMRKVLLKVRDESCVGNYYCRVEVSHWDVSSIILVFRRMGFRVEYNVKKNYGLDDTYLIYAEWRK